MKRLVMTLCLALAVSFCATAARAEELTVSAAMSLREAFLEIGRAFEKANPSDKVVFNFSSSGKLRQQIEGGAPVDVYASASRAHMDALQSQGLVVADTRVDFAGNSIVLARPAGSTNVSDFMSLTSSDAGRIAIGNPATSPAGRYAREVLKHLGLWERLGEKLIYAETVRQVLDYLSRQEVDAGIFYATDAMLRPGEVEAVMPAPEGSHGPIQYPVAMVKGTDRPELSRAFMEFVLSKEGQLTLKSRGFREPAPR